ncbi:MAG: DUF547 domain-containing protein [Acidobacteria bacterium]|nr:DUF547 domain-containing protein [Acidobacteriota bacterium]MCL5289032.1 DUF547 domain-containing protein [Acidobacteriota bacterium]
MTSIFRKSAWLVCIALSLGTATAHAQTAAAEQFSFDEFDRITRAYVNERGLVNYAGLKQELQALRVFVDRLAAYGPDNKPDWFPTAESRKRYFLMAYNANVLYIAASAYPDKHSLWSWIGLFKSHEIVLGGRRLSLNVLEHEILRKEFRDPRIHFYINCAARSCPALARGAIPPGETDAALERAVRRFLNDPGHVRVDEASRTLYLSAIFKWFREDFLRYLKEERGLAQPGLAEYAALYLDPDARAALARVPAGQLHIKFLDYDKSLNEQ